MLTSVIKLTVASSSAATTTVSSSTKNFVLATNQFVKESTCEELQPSMTLRLCGNGPQDGETSGFELPLLVPLGETWLPSLQLLLLLSGHGHLLIPMTFSADLDCSDLLDPNLPDQSPMTSSDFKFP